MTRIQSIKAIAEKCGTTGVVCKKLNRRFIGIDQSEKYYKMAKERINKTIEEIF
jgi:DNA modification methylase